MTLPGLPTTMSGVIEMTVIDYEVKGPVRWV